MPGPYVGVSAIINILKGKGTRKRQEKKAGKSWSLYRTNGQTNVRWPSSCNVSVSCLDVSQQGHFLI